MIPVCHQLLDASRKAHSLPVGLASFKEGIAISKVAADMLYSMLRMGTRYQYLLYAIMIYWLWTLGIVLIKVWFAEGSAYSCRWYSRRSEDTTLMDLLN